MTAASAAEDSLVKRIHEAYAGLSPGSRKVADIVLDFPGDLAGYTASELADLAGVSNATVSRFFRRLGYTSFEEVRRSSRRAREWGSPLFTASLRDRSEKIDGALLARFLEEEKTLVAATFAELDPGLLEEVVDALATAERLFFLGYRNSDFLAGYARWQFIQFRRDVHLLVGDRETLAERIADLRRGDLLVLVAMRRLVAGIGRCARAARDAGADILLLTDPSVRGLPALARWSIRCRIDNPHVFDSYVGAMAVLRLLAVATLERLGRKGRARLQAVEALHETLGEFE